MDTPDGAAASAMNALIQSGDPVSGVFPFAGAIIAATELCGCLASSTPSVKKLLHPSLGGAYAAVIGFHFGLEQKFTTYRLRADFSRTIVV
jgi:hypothetical protein